jgi:hypothetical protein
VIQVDFAPSANESPESGNHGAVPAARSGDAAQSGGGGRPARCGEDAGDVAQRGRSSESQESNSTTGVYDEISGMRTPSERSASRADKSKRRHTASWVELLPAVEFLPLLAMAGLVRLGTRVSSTRRRVVALLMSRE